VLWGFVGGTYARFANFLHGPRTLLAHLRGELAKPLGHNPLGALSVLAILGVLLLMATTGLFANDDVLLEAPLYPLVSKASSDLLTYLHTQSQYLIFALVLLHIAAIIYYRIAKREDLLSAMLSGHKQVAVDVPDELAGRRGSIILAALLLAACSVGVWVLVTYSH
jgi:cytochrome b